MPHKSILNLHSQGFSNLWLEKCIGRGDNLRIFVEVCFEFLLDTVWLFLSIMNPLKVHTLWAQQEIIYFIIVQMVSKFNTTKCFRRDSNLRVKRGERPPLPLGHNTS